MNYVFYSFLLILILIFKYNPFNMNNYIFVTYYHRVFKQKTDFVLFNTMKRLTEKLSNRKIKHTKQNKYKSHVHLCILNLIKK